MVWLGGIMEVRLSKQALKFLNKTNEPDKSRLIVGIKNLPNGDIKPLKGNNDLYRLRIGKYRVIFKEYDNIYEIQKVNKRNDIYKRGI